MKPSQLLMRKLGGKEQFIYKNTKFVTFVIDSERITKKMYSDYQPVVKRDDILKSAKELDEELISREEIITKMKALEKKYGKNDYVWDLLKKQLLKVKQK